MFSKVFAPACLVIGVCTLGWIGFQSFFQSDATGSVMIPFLFSVAMITAGVWKLRRSNRVQPAAS